MPLAGIVCDSVTAPVTARAPPIDSCHLIASSGTPNPLGLETSRWSSPVTPVRPAEATETVRTVAVGRSIERVNSEQADSEMQVVATRSQRIGPGRSKRRAAGASGRNPAFAEADGVNAA